MSRLRSKENDYPSQEPAEHPIRTLVRRFQELPRLKKIEVLTNLKLITKDDASRPDLESYSEAFSKAAHEGKLINLWDEVNKVSENPLDTENPFLNDEILSATPLLKVC